MRWLYLLSRVKCLFSLLILAVRLPYTEVTKGLRTALSRWPIIEAILKRSGKVLLVLLSALGGVYAILCLVTAFEAKPELYISSVSWLPERPWPGQETNITLQIENKGGGEAGSFMAELKVNGMKISSFVPGIPPKSLKKIELVWLPERVGEASIWAVVDSSNVIKEADERNNTRPIAIHVDSPKVLFSPSGVRYLLKAEEDRAFEFKIISVDNLTREIGFAITQRPIIENGGVAVGGPVKVFRGGEATVIGHVLTGEDTLPGFYQIEIQGEDEEGNFVGSFKIEVFVESNHEEGTVDEKGIDSSTPNERAICNGQKVCSSDIRITVEPESISVGAHFCFVIENAGKEPRIIENLLVERPNGIIDTNPSLKGLELAPGDTLFFGEGYPSLNWKGSDDSAGGNINQPGRYKVEVIFMAPFCQAHVSSTSSVNVSQ